MKVPVVKTRSCLKWFKDFDENTLRPFLIHKYSKIKKDRDYLIFTLLKDNKNIEQFVDPKQEKSHEVDGQKN